MFFSSESIHLKRRVKQNFEPSIWQLFGFLLLVCLTNTIFLFFILLQNYLFNARFIPHGLVILVESKTIIAQLSN